jgi:hypothetical protein
MLRKRFAFFGRRAAGQAAKGDQEEGEGTAAAAEETASGSEDSEVEETASGSDDSSEGEDSEEEESGEEDEDDDEDADDDEGDSDEADEGESESGEEGEGKSSGSVVLVGKKEADDEEEDAELAEEAALESQVAARQASRTVRKERPRGPGGAPEGGSASGEEDESEGASEGASEVDESEEEEADEGEGDEEGEAAESDEEEAEESEDAASEDAGSVRAGGFGGSGELAPPSSSAVRQGLAGVLMALAQGRDRGEVEALFAELGGPVPGLRGAVRHMGSFQRGGRQVSAVALCFDTLARRATEQEGREEAVLVVEQVMAGLIRWMRDAAAEVPGVWALGRELPPLGRGASPLVAVVFIDALRGTLEGAALLHARQLPKGSPLRPASGERHAEAVMVVPGALLSPATVCAAAVAASRGYAALAMEVDLGAITALHNLGYRAEKGGPCGPEEGGGGEAEAGEAAAEESGGEEQEVERAEDGPGGGNYASSLRRLKALVRESKREAAAIRRVAAPNARFVMLYCV